MLDRTKKYTTRDGRPVTIFNWEARNPKPIFGSIKLIGDADMMAQWTADGEWSRNGGSIHTNDLVQAKTKFYYYTYRAFDNLQGPMHTNRDSIMRWHADAKINRAYNELSEIKEIEL